MRRNELKRSWLIMLATVAVVAVLVSHGKNNMGNELIGVWKVEWSQTNGQPQRFDRLLWVIGPDTVSIVGDDSTADFPLTLDSSQTPGCFDMRGSMASLGIYQRQGDELRVCLGVAQLGGRPTEMETKFGDLRTLTVLRLCHGVAPRPIDAELKDLLVREFGPAKEAGNRPEMDKQADEFVHEILRKPPRGESSTEKYRILEDVSRLVAEVNNGGFHQFFFNYSGDIAIQTAKDLHEIGAHKTAALVEAACRVFPDGQPAPDNGVRRSQLATFSLDQVKALDDLDEKFLAGDEDVYLMLKKFWDGSR